MNAVANQSKSKYIADCQVKHLLVQAAQSWTGQLAIGSRLDVLSKSPQRFASIFEDLAMGLCQSFTSSICGFEALKCNAMPYLPLIFVEGNKPLHTHSAIC